MAQVSIYEGSVFYNTFVGAVPGQMPEERNPYVSQSIHSGQAGGP